MAVVSNVNANFPIPGLDQSSKGFRDNFATIKQELENLQSTTIQLTGGITSEPYQIGSGNPSMVITTSIVGGLIALNPPNHAVQFNDNGVMTGSDLFVYDSNDVRLGIGTGTPAVSLDVRGDVSTAHLMVNELTPGAGSNISFFAANATAYFNTSDSGIDIGTDDSIPLTLVSNGTAGIALTPAGSVGIGTVSPATTLHVFGSQADLSLFDNNLDVADTMIRASTSQFDSTIGWGLQHTPSNFVGGMRIDSNGIISLHAGENNGAQLSTSTARIVIDPAGRVGIGVLSPSYALEVDGDFKTLAITDASLGADRRVGINKEDPYYTLDVAGDIGITGAVIYTIPVLNIDTASIVIDAWPMSEIRSARYTIQCRVGTDPAEQVEIYDYVATHANGTAYGSLLNSFTTGASLGNISVAANSGFVEVSFAGVGNSNLVTFSKTYIRN